MRPSLNAGFDHHIDRAAGDDEVLHVVAPHQDELAARIDGGRLHDAETQVARPEKAVSAGRPVTKVRKAQTMRAVSATTNRMVAMA